MKKRSRLTGIVSGIILSFCMATASFAADTSWDPNREVSLTVEIRNKNKGLNGGVAVYRIADFEKSNNNQMKYKVLDVYKGIHDNLNDKSAGELQKCAEDFAVQKSESTLVEEGKLDSEGCIYFKSDRLTQGLYLVVPKELKGYVAAPFLISLPGNGNTDGTSQIVWKYDMVCKPKSIRMKPDLPKTGEKTPKPGLPKTKGKRPLLPKTGDTNNMVKYAGLGLCSLAIMLVCLKKKKKLDTDSEIHL